MPGEGFQERSWGELRMGWWYFLARFSMLGWSNFLARRSKRLRSWGPKEALRARAPAKLQKAGTLLWKLST